MATDRNDGVDRTDGEMHVTDDRVGGFSIPDYDNILMTYVASGNGQGEVETVVYKLGTTAVATLTHAYDASNNLSTVTKS